MGALELEAEYDSCDRSAPISFLKLLTLRIIQSNPAKAMMQARPSTAPTAAPTTVAVLLTFESSEAVSVMIDVTFAVAVAESLEVIEVEVPGTTLSMKRPK